MQYPELMRLGIEKLLIDLTILLGAIGLREEAKKSHCIARPMNIENQDATVLAKLGFNARCTRRVRPAPKKRCCVF